MIQAYSCQNIIVVDDFTGLLKIKVAVDLTQYVAEGWV